MLIPHADADTGADLADSGEEERAQGWSVLFLFVVHADVDANTSC